MSKGINFTKDYQKDSYNKTKLMGENLKRSKCINHIQKALRP
jgi:hypothetical protein